MIEFTVPLLLKIIIDHRQSVYILYRQKIIK